MTDRTRTIQQQLDALQGQVLALTLYLRAALDKHPSAHQALDMAEAEIERMTATLLARPFADEMLDGIDLVRKRLGRSPLQRPPPRSPVR